MVGDQAENVTHRKLIVELATDSRLPTIYPFSDHVHLGGLMSYGPNIAEHMRTVAGQIDQILKGGKHSDMPIQQARKFELIINLKATNALEVTIPASLLARADQVIE